MGSRQGALRVPAPARENMRREGEEAGGKAGQLGEAQVRIGARGGGGTLQKADQTVPSASHPFLDPPPEAARAGVSVPEAGTEARAGLRGKLPGSG